jgi:hypothetical protein
MRWMKWISLAAAIALIVSCFSPWVTIPGRNITITGIDATGTTFGKPGYFNLLMTGVYILLTFVPRLWAKRLNLIVAAINIAWAFRNFIILSRCEGGECPEKQTAFYIMLFASVVMLLGSLLTDTGKKNY